MELLCICRPLPLYKVPSSVLARSLCVYVVCTRWRDVYSLFAAHTIPVQLCRFGGYYAVVIVVLFVHEKYISAVATGRSVAPR